MPHDYVFFNAPLRDSAIFSTQLLVRMRIKSFQFFSKFYVAVSLLSSFWEIRWTYTDCVGVRNRLGKAGFRAESGSERGVFRASPRAALRGPGGVSVRTVLPQVAR